jgi:hypothetical protein
MPSRGVVWSVLVVTVLTAAACERDRGGNVRPSHETQEVGQRTGAAGHDLGQAVVHGAKGAASGAVCGTRELGQTMSGTQGVPQAEALSREACDKAEQQANEAAHAMDSVAKDLHPAAQGGGPVR